MAEQAAALVQLTLTDPDWGAAPATTYWARYVFVPLFHGLPVTALPENGEGIVNVPGLEVHPSTITKRLFVPVVAPHVADTEVPPKPRLASVPEACEPAA